MSTPRKILVVGATGQQGRAFIKSTLASTDFHLVALTRDASTPQARALANDRVQLAQVDLNKPASVRKVFEDAVAEGNGIWGVFVVLAFPGLGANADGELAQGMLLADLGHEFKVAHFVFSSVERGGEGYDDELTLDRLAKVKIEQHIRSLEGLSWTILRPGFFMENMVGTIGAITVAVLRCGLNPGTKVQLIAAEDIGHIARVVFQNPELHKSKAIDVVGDWLTANEQAEAYRRGAGTKLPSVLSLFGRALIAWNKHTKDLIADMERVYRTNAALDGGYEVAIANCRSLYPGMLTFEEWARTRGAKGSRPDGWNNVNVKDLALGKR